jgi:hypothetical protein
MLRATADLCRGRLAEYPLHRIDEVLKLAFRNHDDTIECAGGPHPRVTARERGVEGRMAGNLTSRLSSVHLAGGETVFRRGMAQRGTEELPAGASRHAELDLIGRRMGSLPASRAVDRLRAAIGGYRMDRALASPNAQQQSDDHVIRALHAAVAAIHQDLLDLDRRVSALESGSAGSAPPAQ